jgi:hypothetical protein
MEATCTGGMEDEMCNLKKSFDLVELNGLEAMQRKLLFQIN